MFPTRVFPDFLFLLLSQISEQPGVFFLPTRLITPPALFFSSHSQAQRENRCFLVQPPRIFSDSRCFTLPQPKIPFFEVPLSTLSSFFFFPVRRRLFSPPLLGKGGGGANPLAPRLDPSFFVAFSQRTDPNGSGGFFPLLVF